MQCLILVLRGGKDVLYPNNLRIWNLNSEWEAIIFLGWTLFFWLELVVLRFLQKQEWKIRERTFKVSKMLLLYKLDEGGGGNKNITKATNFISHEIRHHQQSELMEIFIIFWVALFNRDTSTYFVSFTQLPELDCNTWLWYCVVKLLLKYWCLWEICYIADLFPMFAFEL